MIDQILATPGNQHVYGRLKTLLAEGSAIAFIGAGASFPLYPLWPQLTQKLAHEPVERGLASAADEEYWLRNAASKPLQMASQIHAKLGDALYHTFLWETFKDQSHYTSAQGALVRANFKAYITTNYDGGILEARRVLRPDIRDTGFTVWNQGYHVNRWSSGDIFKDSQCPVLFAHGHHADPPGIVLDYGSYRDAYHNTPYRRFFENLWFQQRLVFVGFSFNDIVLGQIADEVLLQTTRQGGGEPRHSAILGLPEDQEYTPEMRREFREGYDAEMLFYTVTKTADGHPDHSALQPLLESLANRPMVHVVASKPAPSTAAPLRFVHESTDDEKFTGRVEILTRLDRWAADSTVRLIAISGIGGLGKTALVGHWLRNITSDTRFFWSFYRERNPQEFFKALIAFGVEELGWEPSKEKPALRALDLIRLRRIVVVVDGLEVIQESPGTVAYGKLIEIELSDFLHAHCQSSGASLVVLTSRFPFPDLTPYLGGSLRSLPLPSLEPAEGSKLLASLGLGGRTEDREEISRQLFGHPLALRIFARSFSPDKLGDPTRLVDSAHLAADDPLEAKMRRLLEFYEKRLPGSQRKALGFLAPFRAPVGEAALAPLWEKMPGKDAGPLREALRQLRQEHLVTTDPGKSGEDLYTCHPILRDHFRIQLIGNPASVREAASLIAGQPDAQNARSLPAVRIIAAAIELLLDVGELKAADDLYNSRMENGNLFQWIPAPHLGMQVARGFVHDQTTRDRIAQQFGPPRLSFLLNDVGRFANAAGEPETALEFLGQAIAVDRNGDYCTGECVKLQNLGEAEISLGRLTDAASHFAEALKLAQTSEDDKGARNTLAAAGHISSLHGNFDSANVHFSEANSIENRMHREGVDLYSLRGIQWAEHLLRIGTETRARRLTEANLKICGRNGWQLDVARCEWILGWLDTLTSRWSDAHSYLGRAKAIFTAGHMIYDLARLFVTESACYLGERQWEPALTSCERALQLAAPRKYRLVQADALNLRARIRLERPDPDPVNARDDAEAALQLANFCDYHWARRDAEAILSRAAKA